MEVKIYKNRMKKKVLGGLLSIVLVLCCIMSSVSVASAASKTTYSPKALGEDVALTNPYMGWVPNAKEYGSITQDVTLVYVPILWKDLQPNSADDFAWDTIRKTYHFSDWEKQGVKFVIRFYMDDPVSSSKEIKSKHMDIPAWLDKEIGHAGTEYYFKNGGTYWEGFSPDYNNKKFNMRYPNSYARDKKMGLFNDMFGDVASWEEDWGQKKKLENTKMNDFWKYASSGGEFANGDSKKYLNKSNIDVCISQAKEGHVSWLGPCTPAKIKKNDSTYQKYVDKLLAKMGYRFRIGKVEFNNTMKADAEGKNGYEIKGKLKVPAEVADGKYTLVTCISDPSTHEPGVNLAIEGKIDSSKKYDWYNVGSVTVSTKTVKEEKPVAATTETPVTAAPASTSDDPDFGIDWSNIKSSVSSSSQDAKSIKVYQDSENVYIRVEGNNFEELSQLYIDSDGTKKTGFKDAKKTKKDREVVCTLPKKGNYLYIPINK